MPRWDLWRRKKKRWRRRKSRRRRRKEEGKTKIPGLGKDFRWVKLRDLPARPKPLTTCQVPNFDLPSPNGIFKPGAGIRGDLFTVNLKPTLQP